MALAEILEDADEPPAEIMRRMWARVADPALWPNERLFFEVYAQALQGSPHALPLLDGIVDAWVEPLAALVAPGPAGGGGPRRGAPRRRGRARAAARPAGDRRPRGRRRRHGALHLRDSARIAGLSGRTFVRVFPMPSAASERLASGRWRIAIAQWRGRRRPRGPRGRGRARPAGPSGSPASRSACGSASKGACARSSTPASSGPSEEPRPDDEIYPVHTFPALVTLLERRTPYCFGPGDRVDVSSASLAARLGKETQGAAPIAWRGEVWGSLWVATAARGAAADHRRRPAHRARRRRGRARARRRRGGRRSAAALKQPAHRERRQQHHRDDPQALHGDDERRVRAGAVGHGEHRVEAARAWWRGRRRAASRTSWRRAGARGRSTRPAARRWRAAPGTVRRPSSRTVSGVKRSPTCRPISAKAVCPSRSGTAKPSARPASTTAPVRIIGPSSTPAVTRSRRRPPTRRRAPGRP